MAQKGVDSTLADLSVCTSINDDSQSTIAEQGDRYRLSILRSTDNHDYVNVTTASEPQSLSSGFPSLLPGDFHIKVTESSLLLLMQSVHEVFSWANLQLGPGDSRLTYRCTELVKSTY